MFLRSLILIALLGGALLLPTTAADKTGGAVRYVRCQVGQKVISKAVHGVSQFQLLATAALVSHHRLLQGGRMPGQVGRQRPLAEMVGIIGRQLQVATQGNHG